MDWWGGGECNHNPIVLEVKGGFQKPPSPSKFNASWIVDTEFNGLLNSTSIHLDDGEGSRESLLFMENLKRLKKATI